MCDVTLTNKCIYLTLCMFSFEIKESGQSDTRCLIQDVVSPHCGDKRMTWCCTRSSLPNYFVMTSYHLNAICWKWSNSDDTLVNEQQQITWCHTQNVVSLRVLYKFVNFNSNLVICLKFVFIEMLDKLMTYIVWWYKNLHQVFFACLAWTNPTTTHCYRDS